MYAQRVPFIAVLVSMALSGCSLFSSEDANPDPAHNASNALDWAGSYRGVLPCADCEGIETVLVLNGDGSYAEHTKYLEEDPILFSTEGQFMWNEAGNTVTLEGPEPARYFVGENHLVHLALDGSRVEGPLAESYVLTKVSESVTERRWKLVELNGRPVPALEREPYFTLHSDEGRVSGFGGCNNFMGSYTLDEATLRIRFEDLASTLMACNTGMEVETSFHEVLRGVDNYSLSGDNLSLNRARMAPLARFEAVYLF
jgi:copper homeostasis protein (lipoprotein)